MTTSIPSTILGLGPDPALGPTFGLGLDSGVEDPQFMHGGRVPRPSAGSAPPPQDQYSAGSVAPLEDQSSAGSAAPPVDQSSDPPFDPSTNAKHPDVEPDSTPAGFSLLGMVQHALSNLATKFGYLKRPASIAEAPAVPPAVEDLEAVEVLGDIEATEFQCMSDAESPILMDGKPVIVTEPQECHKYFTDYARFADPQEFFFTAAREVFKSNMLLSFCRLEE